MTGIAKGRPGNIQRRLSEGWQFDLDEKTGKDFICRVTTEQSYGGTLSVFATDEEALAFVWKRAEEGSEYHQQCLAYAISERMR